MKKDIVYKLDMTLNDNGDVVTASCGCPAGGRPHGSCKHIAALCYTLEAYCRFVEETRLQDSCTSRPQVWNRPRKRRLPPQEIDEITFIKEEYGKSKRPMQPMQYDPRPAELQHTSTDEIRGLRDALLAVKMLPFCTSCPFQAPLHQIQVRDSIIMRLWFRYAIFIYRI